MDGGQTAAWIGVGSGRDNSMFSCVGVLSFGSAVGLQLLQNVGMQLVPSSILVLSKMW